MLCAPSRVSPSSRVVFLLGRASFWRGVEFHDGHPLHAQSCTPGLEPGGWVRRDSEPASWERALRGDGCGSWGGADTWARIWGTLAQAPCWVGPGRALAWEGRGPPEEETLGRGGGAQEAQVSVPDALPTWHGKGAMLPTATCCLGGVAIKPRRPGPGGRVSSHAHRLRSGFSSPAARFLIPGRRGCPECGRLCALKCGSVVCAQQRYRILGDAT